MIGLDTNVLVRYIVRDDEQEARDATRLIERNCSAEEPGVVGLVVLCELVWVLSRGYGYDRGQVAEVLRRLLTADDLTIDRAELGWRALNLYEAGPADYADYVIALIHQVNNAETTYTFDRRAAKSDLFRIVPRR